MKDKRLKKGIGGLLVAVLLITSIAVVTIPMAAGVTGRCISGYKLDNATGLGLEGWTIRVTNEYGG